MRDAGGWCGRQHADKRDGPRPGDGRGPDAVGHPADTYADFLLMTRGPLPCEPSAAQRACGHAVH